MARRTYAHRRFVVAPFWAAIAVAIAASTPGDRVIAAASPCSSTVIFWAWERAEDLRFLDARCTAVAWFAGRIDVDAATLRLRPREQALEIDPSEANWPVLRVDAHGEPPSAAADASRRADFVRNMRRFVRADHLARGLQIDFDAPRSWRPFYQRLLDDLAAAMPHGAPLTMTALASWCMDDAWLRDTTPATAAVPMLFRMGPDALAIRRALAAGAAFRAPQCRGSVGVSIDEPVPQRPVRTAGRVYVFAPRAWTPELVDRAYTLTGITRPQRLQGVRP